MNSRFFKSLITITLFVTASQLLSAQAEDKFDFERIEDNSFLLEEAYNQEAGVIQHISSFQYMNDKTWAYSFTDEWPVTGQRHQLSASLILLGNDNTGLGDVALNYRYQAILRERFAFSPRFSLLLPTGNYKKGLGNGVVGFQTNMPVSYIWTHWLVTHYNLGLTYTPSARDALSNKSDITTVNYGASAIFLISPTFNFMVELAGNSGFTKPESSEVVRNNSLFINPGIRYAINFKSGLQIVPGIAFPVGLGSSSGDYGIFGYLSFEHPLRILKQ